VAVYKCSVCDTEYDEEKEGLNGEDLPADWVCPVCDTPKSMFQRMEGAAAECQAAMEVGEPAARVLVRRPFLTP